MKRSFFQNRGLIFKNSDSDFRDHMTKKNCEKIEISGFITKFHLFSENFAGKRLWFVSYNGDSPNFPRARILERRNAPRPRSEKERLRHQSKYRA